MRASKMTTFSAPPHHARGRDAAAKKIRCSRPLCSSQTTTRTTHPTHHGKPVALRRGRNRTNSRIDPHTHTPGHRPTAPRGPRAGNPVLLSQDPTVCQHPQPLHARAVLPHAGAATPTTAGAPIPDAVLRTTAPVRPGAPFVDVPPMSTRRPTNGTATGIPNGPPRHTGIRPGR